MKSKQATLSASLLREKSEKHSSSAKAWRHGLFQCFFPDVEN